MMALPNARSHGLGGGARAHPAALTGKSAAKAGAAETTASAATTDKQTFFIEPAPFRSIDFQPIQIAHHSAYKTNSAAIDPYAKGRALGLNLHLRHPVPSSRKRDHLPPF